MRGVLVLIITSVLTMPMVRASAPAPYHGFTQYDVNARTKTSTSGAEFVLWQFEIMPLLLHTKYSHALETTNESIIHTYRYTAQLGSVLRTPPLTHAVYAGGILQYKDGYRSIAPVLTLNSVWDVQSLGFVQYYMNVEGGTTPRLFQKIAWGYPVLGFKLGPFVQGQIERGQPTQYAAGIFAAGLTVWNLEFVPYVGVEWRDRRFGYMAGIYNKRMFTSFMPAFLEPEPRTYIPVPIERLRPHHVRPKMVRLSKNRIRYIMPVRQTRSLFE